LTWQTSCNDIREQPYQITFRAQDNPGAGATPLVDYKTMLITVLGPKPTNLTVTGSGKGFLLSWLPYSCHNADSIEIFRKECSSGYIPQPCQQGLSSSAGYNYVGSVPGNATSYTDTTITSRTALYCYVIVAAFPFPGYGKSVPSDEVCGSLSLNVPIISNVTVTQTDSAKGKITIKWFQPFQDTASLSKPYTYSVQRAVNNGSIYTTIASGLTDTTYTDSLLNTVKNQYTYKILFYYGTPSTYSGSSESASSVFLKGKSNGLSATLTWQAIDPWNAKGLYQVIYREHKPGNFILEDSILASSNASEYIDTKNLVKGDTFCYYIETRGKYCR